MLIHGSGDTKKAGPFLKPCFRTIYLFSVIQQEPLPVFQDLS